ncbi:MAG: hypothetical protein ACUZ8E_04815 [Candidatus Anammoxibacter sp.]
MATRKIIPFFIIFFLCITASRYSYSIELAPSEEQIENALKIGMSHNVNIFGLDEIKPACFGDWPGGDGGIVETKLIYLAIISSMRFNAGMPDVSKEKIESIMNSKDMPIRISSTQKVFNVLLKQNGRTIEPSRIEEGMQMPPGGGSGGGSHPQSLKVYFNYSELNPKAKTTIVLVEDYGEIEFDIEFAKFD